MEIIPKKVHLKMKNRWLKWLLDGLLLIVLIPMVIPSSDETGLAATRTIQLLPVFAVLVGFRFFCVEGMKVSAELTVVKLQG